MGQSRWHGSGDLRVVAGLAVGPRERVVLMQVGAQQVLLGVTPGSVRMLLILDEPLGQQQGPGSRHAAREAREPVIEGFRRSLVAALHASRHDEEPGGRP
jgi:flagellar protein FliO/FliZ